MQTAADAPEATDLSADASIQPKSKRFGFARLADRLPITLVVAIYLWLAIAGALTDPLFAKPDEPFHFAYFTNLKLRGQMPQVDLRKSAGEHPPVEMEAHQPPLYYVTTLLSTAILPKPDESFAVWNPHLLTTDVGNRSSRAPSYVSDPFGGPVAAFVAGRLVSVAFGTLTLLASYALLTSLLGKLAAATTVGLIAFNPQFIFISSSFSNDAAEAGTATLAIWLLLLLNRRQHSIRLGFGVGVGLSASILAKLSGLGLLVIIPFLAAADYWRFRRIRVLIPWAVASGVAATGTAWWFWRNHRLYGDPLALNVLPSILGQHGATPTVEEWTSFLTFAWKSYWFDLSGGAMGFATDVTYWILAILLALSFSSAAIAFVRLPASRKETIVLALWLAAVLIPFLKMGNQTATLMGGGRLLFPATTAVAGLMGLGLRFAGHRLRLPLLPAVALGFLIFAVWSQYGYIQPLNPTPKLISQETARPKQSLNAQVGDVIRLIGVDANTAGGEMVVTYYWITSGHPSADYSVFLQEMIRRPGGDNSVVSQIDTFPGYGSTRTGLWQQGNVVADTLRLKYVEVDRLPDDASLLLVTGLYDSRSKKRLPINVPERPEMVLYGDTLVLADLSNVWLREGSK